MTRQLSDDESDQILRLALHYVKDFLGDSANVVTELGASEKFEDYDAYLDFWEGVYMEDYTPECERILAEALAKALLDVPGFDDWYESHRENYLGLEPESSDSGSGG